MECVSPNYAGSGRSPVEHRKGDSRAPEGQQKIAGRVTVDRRKSDSRAPEG